MEKVVFKLYNIATRWKTLKACYRLLIASHFKTKEQWLFVQIAKRLCSNLRTQKRSLSHLKQRKEEKTKILQCETNVLKWSWVVDVYSVHNDEPISFSFVILCTKLNVSSISRAELSNGKSLEFATKSVHVNLVLSGLSFVCSIKWSGWQKSCLCEYVCFCVCVFFFCGGCGFVWLFMVVVVDLLQLVPFFILVFLHQTMGCPAEFLCLIRHSFGTVL